MDYMTPQVEKFEEYFNWCKKNKGAVDSEKVKYYFFLFNALPNDNIPGAIHGWRQAYSSYVIPTIGESKFFLENRDLSFSQIVEKDLSVFKIYLGSIVNNSYILETGTNEKTELSFSNFFKIGNYRIQLFLKKNFKKFQSIEKSKLSKSVLDQLEYLIKKIEQSIIIDHLDHFYIEENDSWYEFTKEKEEKELCLLLLGL